MKRWLLLFLSAPVFALDLKSAIRSAIENSPQLKGMQAQVQSYEGKKLSYRSALNPAVSFEVGNFGTSKESFSKMPLYGITYTQPLVYPSLFRSAREVYSLQSKALDYNIQAEKNKIAYDVYLLFYQALYLKELLKVLEKEVDLQREIRDFVERSFRLGETTRLELFRAQRELELLESEKRVAQAKYTALLQELSALVGEEVKEVEGELTLPEWKEPLLAESPIFRYYSTIIESLSKQMQVEKILSRPTYAVNFTAEKVADREYGFRVAISVGIPLFYRREGEMLELTAQKELLSAEMKAQMQKANAQLGSAKVQFQRLRQEIERIERELLPQAQKELELALKSYRLRTITLFELSQTRKSYYDLLKRRLELLLSAHSEYAKGIVFGGSAWCGCY